MPRPNVNGSRNSSRDIKDQLKAELEAETYEYNLKVAKYRLASLLEFCNEQNIDFDIVLDEVDALSSNTTTSKVKNALKGLM